MACHACREHTEAGAASPPRHSRTGPSATAAAGVPVFLQATVSQRGDPEEVEAERWSAEFVKGRQDGGGCGCSSAGRDGACSCGSAAGARTTVMREARTAGAVRRTPNASLPRTPRSGLTLAPETRRPYEEFFHADLSHVRVHDGADANTSAKALHARAYTYGRDIVFAAGEFAPHTERGQALLAHELTHVVRHGSRASTSSRQASHGRRGASRQAAETASTPRHQTQDRSRADMHFSLQSRPDAAIKRAPESAAGGTEQAGDLPRYLREGTIDAGTMDAGVPDAGSTPADASLPGGVPAPPAPVSPDACPTPEEEARKTAFRARSFSALDFRPSAGYGKFDAYYWPSISLMATIVKMKFNYVQADNTPDLMTLWSMVLSGQDITRFFWTEAEKTQFAEDYRRRVAERWSFAHTFRSTKPCWPFTASPYIAPSVVDDAASAHFEVTVHKSPGPGIDYKSAFKAKNPATAGWRGTGNLYSSDVHEESDFNSTQVAQAERQRLERAVAAAAASPVLFDNNSAVVRPADVARLQTLAAAMNAKNPSDPAIPIVISGFASSEGGRTHNEQLSEDRANAVADILRAAGVPQPLVITMRGPIGAPNDAANRKVEVAPSTTFEGSYASNRYSVAEHEFGHTIGLPDEYLNITTGDLGAKQTAFILLAQKAGVAPPDQWGDTTSSQMSGGVDVLPRHYLTVWEALGAMTAPDITLDEWAID